MNNELKLRLFLVLFIGQSFSPSLLAQTYSDYYGTGQTIDLTVTGSDAQNGDTPTGTVSGTDLIPDLVGASRFLAQSTMGSNYEEMEYVSQVGVDTWLDEQFAIPASSYLTTYTDIFDEAIAAITAVHGNNIDQDPRHDYLSFSFYQKLMTEEDQLRQKMAFALSQIFVVSTNGTTLDAGFGISSYYDQLYQGAFGNFYDLLRNVTYHPIMGGYLSTYKNKKEDPVEGTLPDENYAREVMQLFTIGLFELNNDGSFQLDANGDLIPTYDIEDIQELAKVFTGFSGGAWDPIYYPQNAGLTPTFDLNIYQTDLTTPMLMYDQEHDSTPKVMVDGSILPGGQTGVEDVDGALNILFNHPNVGPFISLRLIQHTVKSNPSPAYINRVATVFNDNGQGVRGDLQEVIRAILIDPEARDCSWIDDTQTGRLKQPMERFTHLWKAFDIQTPSGKYWLQDNTAFYSLVEQAFMWSPSVFNFFSPLYAEPGLVAPNDMVSPEFQILHSTSGIHYINIIEYVLKTVHFPNNTAVHPVQERMTVNPSDFGSFDFSDEINILDTQGIEALINRLDLILCHGQLSDDIRLLIENAYYQNSGNSGAAYSSEDAVIDAIYFMMVSSDYTILK